MLRVGTLFEFAYLMFYAQRASVNEDSCYRARRALTVYCSLGYSHVIIIAFKSVVTIVTNCIMITQVTVKSMDNCDVITTAYRC